MVSFQCLFLIQLIWQQMSKSLCSGEETEKGEPGILTSCPLSSHPLLQTPIGTPEPLTQEQTWVCP